MESNRKIKKTEKKIEINKAKKVEKRKENKVEIKKRNKKKETKKKQKKGKRYTFLGFKPLLLLVSFRAKQARLSQTQNINVLSLAYLLFAVGAVPSLRSIYGRNNRRI